MDEDELLRVGQALRLGRRLGQRVAVQDDLRAVRPRMRDLGVGREGRHDDGRRDAEPAGMIGNALCVVAGRHGDDAAPAFLVGELKQRVQSSALLEGGGELEILELHPNAGPRDARQRLAVEAGRAHDGARDARGRGAHVGERDGEGVGDGGVHANLRSSQSRVR